MPFSTPRSGSCSQTWNTDSSSALSKHGSRRDLREIFSQFSEEECIPPRKSIHAYSCRPMDLNGQHQDYQLHISSIQISTNQLSAATSISISTHEAHMSCLDMLIDTPRSARWSLPERPSDCNPSVCQIRLVEDVIKRLAIILRFMSWR
jgi:hypothetical protein